MPSPNPDELYLRLEAPEGLARCPVCRAKAELWEYKESDGVYTKVVMCARGESFGPQLKTGGLVSEGCLLYMPPNDFYRPTKREAVAYWNEYSDALIELRTEAP